jgi:hypothetical protein
MKDKTLRYVSKVWLTTVLIAPVLLGIYQGIIYAGGFVWWVFYGVLFGAVLGAPSFILLWLATRWLINATHQVRCKLYLSILIIPLAALSVIIGYALIRYSADTMYLAIPYIIVAIAAIWLFKLKPVKRTNQR